MASNDFPGWGTRASFELSLTADAPAVWTVSDATDPDHVGGFGKVLLQRYHVAVDSTPALEGEDGDAHAMEIVLLEPRGGIRVANDNAAWITDIDGNPVIGRDPAVAALSTGDTLIAWIGLDGHVHARLYPFSDDFIAPAHADTLELVRPEHESINALLKDLGEAPPADVTLPGSNRRLQVNELGPGQFAVMWIALAASGLGLHGKVYSFDTVPGESSPGWSEHKLAVALPENIAGEVSVSALGDGSSLAVSYQVADAGQTSTVVQILDEAGTGDLSPTTTHAMAEQVDLVPAAHDDTSFHALLGPVTAADHEATEHAGVVLVGDSTRGDVLVGTDQDDVLIGDLPTQADAQSTAGQPAGGDDVLIGGRGSDILFGGGGNDILDGGRGEAATDSKHPKAPAPEKDVAVYQGNALDYSITVNGDGSYTVLDARSDGGPPAGSQGGQVFNLDGVDKASNIEEFRFLDGDLSWLEKIANGSGNVPPAPGQGIGADDLFHLPDQDERVTGNVDAQTGTPDADPVGVETVTTPVVWGTTADMAANGLQVTDTADTAETCPVAAQTADGFAVGWTVDNGDGTATLNITAYDAAGMPKSVGDGPGTVIVATTNADADVPPALAGVCDGTAAAWVEHSSDGSVDLAVQLFGDDGTPVGSGCTTVASGDEGTTYSDLSIASQSVSSGSSWGSDGSEWHGRFSVVWVQNPDVDGNGDVMVQSYGVPAEGEGAPVALGQDGAAEQPSDVAPDAAPEVANDDAPYKVGEGSGAEAAGLYGGELAVVWVESSSGSGGHSKIKGVVLSPSGDKVLNIDLSDFAQDGDIQGKPKILEGNNGDILVAWMKDLDDQAGNVVELAVYPPGSDCKWAQPTAKLQLKHFDDGHDPKEFSIGVVGDDRSSLVVTWKDGDDGQIHGQQYDYAGSAVGGEFKVLGDADTYAGDLAQHSVVSLPDGRFVVTYLDASDGVADVGAQVFDPRSAEAPVIGDATDGTHVGTVFDDIIDGQGNQDGIYGALGDDVLIGGTSDDHLFGGAGNDQLIGGTGTDLLRGEEGDDWLQGGHGRDYISGGAGEDTISYKGEARSVIVDLDAGTVLSEGDHNAAVAGDGMPGLDPTTIDGKTYTVEDVIGTVDKVGGVDTFTATHDVENVEGGLGNDTLRGDAGDNKLTGGEGDDVLEGRGGNDVLDGGTGNDKAVFSGSMDEYQIKVDDRGTSDDKDDIFTIVHVGGNGADGVDTLTNIETFQFNGTVFARGELNLTLTGSNANDSLVGGDGNDRLEGGAGSDFLTGGYGNDTFVFKPGFGSDVILDFHNTPANDDTIEISGSVYSSYEEMLEAHALAPDDHGNVLFALGDDTIVFKGLDIRTLNADDFKFI